MYISTNHNELLSSVAMRGDIPQAYLFWYYNTIPNGNLCVLELIRVTRFHEQSSSSSTTPKLIHRITGSNEYGNKPYHTLAYDKIYESLLLSL